MAIFGFLQKIKSQTLTTRASVSETYRSLVLRAAESGDLNAKDAQDFAVAMTALGISPDAAADDCQAALRVRQHEAGQYLDSNVLLALQLAHPRLWSIRDTRNEVHLARGIRGEPRRPGTIMIETFDWAIEKNLASGGMTITRAPSQTAEEFDALHRDLLAFRDGARYLRRQAQRHKLPELELEGAGEVLENLMNVSDVPQSLPTFLPWPGLSQSDLDSMLKELKTFYEKLPVKKTGYAYA